MSAGMKLLFVIQLLFVGMVFWRVLNNVIMATKLDAMAVVLYRGMSVLEILAGVLSVRNPQFVGMEWLTRESNAIMATG